MSWQVVFVFVVLHRFCKLKTCYLKYRFQGSYACLWKISTYNDWIAAALCYQEYCLFFASGNGHFMQLQDMNWEYWELLTPGDEVKFSVGWLWFSHSGVNSLKKKSLALLLHLIWAAFKQLHQSIHHWWSTESVAPVTLQISNKILEKNVPPQTIWVNSKHTDQIPLNLVKQQNNNKDYIL